MAIHKINQSINQSLRKLIIPAICSSLRLSAYNTNERKTLLLYRELTLLRPEGLFIKVHAIGQDSPLYIFRGYMLLFPKNVFFFDD